jgi:hypothetical protein
MTKTEKRRSKMKKLMLAMAMVLVMAGSAMADGILCHSPGGAVRFEKSGECKDNWKAVPLPEPAKPDLIVSQHLFGSPCVGSLCLFPDPNPPDPFMHPGINFGAEYSVMRNEDGSPVAFKLFSDWYSFTYIYYYRLKCVYPEYVLNFPEGTPVCE